jgi:ATP-dependent Clp protease protease subunit
VRSDRSVDDVMADIDRDRFMTAEEARDYGLIDGITERRGIPQHGFRNGR